METIGNLNKAKQLSTDKATYYKGIPRMNEWEIGGVISHGVAAVSEIAATVSNIIAAAAHIVPKIEAGAEGFGGSPRLTVKFGGENVGNSAAQFAALFQGISTVAHSVGSMLETQGSYTRRDNENQYLGSAADLEVEQIQFQINAAMIRQAIAEKDLENQELQIDNAKTADEYMRNKYTNEQLYNWMVTQIAGVYFQAYQTAYDMAKKAEQCYQYELGIQNSSFIQFGYWDSLKKGLLSGDKLLQDLRRLETDYLEQNKRELEITKNISIAQIAPLSLVTLKETGRCQLSLPEWLFDMDYPGHYMRRIKSISVSIPCVAGPYTSINCTLSLVKSTTRMDATIASGQYSQIDENDTRFNTQLGSISSIATSHAQADSGLFELDFRDERYLPFEGAGVISDWQVEMPQENNYFDFATISDLILQVNYTARVGGNILAGAANTHLQSVLPDKVTKLFNVKHEFPDAWHRFINPGEGNDQEFVIDLTHMNYPFFIRSKVNTMKIKKIELFMDSDHVGDFEMLMKVTNTDYESSLSDVSPSVHFNNAFYALRDYESGVKPNALGQLRFKIKVKGGPSDFRSITPDKINNLFLLFHLSK